ncbi:zinc finger protein 664-like isoform X2 [Adelges cooleyi]|uniref:zinc finger protein 664-like isoform X2 n=1 Tax=Adelges cooleyi TaxID=133065 RepID=UPI00217F623D|nr:zinc finger protein 664-like isoform X2 [Adelges cooleyi]
MDSGLFVAVKLVDEQRVKIKIGETDDYYYASTIQVVKGNEQFSGELTEKLGEKIKTSFVEKTCNSCATTQNDLQRTFDGNTYKVNQVITKNYNTDDYNHENMIKVEEDLEEKTKPNYSEKSDNDVTTQNYSQTIIDGNLYKFARETYNGTIVKVEADLVNGNYFESVVEVEKNWLLDQTMNYDLDKIRTYGCDLCQESFSTKRKVARHITKSHSVIPKSQESTRKQVVKLYKCDVCLKCFSCKGTLTAHERVHTGEKPYKCDVCKKTFSQKAHLALHQRVHTGEKPYKCDVCKKTFTYKGNLALHERVHTGEKPYTCGVCWKSFLDKSTLTKHKRIHTGERPYKCDVCHKCFSQKASLTNHKRLHTGEKHYKCDVCSTPFADLSTLTKHKRVHTGEKPYECDLCLKLFTDKYHLTRHKLVHIVVKKKKYKSN